MDPWALEAAPPKPPARRPELGPVRPGPVLALGLLAALRALGLVLIAGAVAAGVAGLQRGDLDPRAVLVGGVSGAILRAGAGWAADVVARRLAITVKSTLRAGLWRRIVAGDAGRDGGVAVLATDGLEHLDDYYVRSVPAMIGAVVVPAVVGLRILGADALSAIVVVATVPLIPFFMVLIGRHTQARTDQALGALTRLADHLTELARGLPVLVGLNRVEEQARALDGIQRAYRARAQETLRWAFLSSLALELIATISVAIVAVLLGLRLLHGTVELEAALLVLVLAPECFVAVREVGTAFHASQDGLSALQRVRALLSRPGRTDVRAREAEPVDAAGAGPGLEPDGVAVRGLTVRYAGRERPTLAGLDARLAGIVAITGPSGAGKSTLLAALAGTLPTDAELAGSIVQDPDDVGWAPQAPRAFASTPREELALHGAADPAAALAELGLRGVADARVAELSPGEMRRLAVARALVRVDRGASLLLLDEPTAHLDREAAERVRAAILARAHRATVVLATHEPETLALAGMRVDLTGSCVERGSAATEPTPSTRPPSSLAQRARPGDERGEEAEPARRSGRSDAAVPWLGGVALAFAAAALGLALSAVSGWLIVRASVEQHIMHLLVAIVGVRFFGIGRSVARYGERLATHEAAFRMVDALRLRLWRSIAARGAGSRRLLEGGAPVDYLVVLADALRDLLPRIIPPLVVGALSIAGIGVTAALVLPEAAGPLVAVLGGAVVLGALLALAGSPAAQRARIRERSALVRGTASLAAAADDLRGNAAAGAALAALAEADARLAAAERRTAWAGGAGIATVALATSAVAALVPVWAPTAPAELACVLALLSLAALEPFADLITAVHRLPALAEVRAGLAPVLADRPAPPAGTAAPASPVWELRLDGLAARYPGVGSDVFARVDAAVRTGGRLVVAGPSGSGKSTLLSVVMGTLPAAAGAVRVDGVPLAELAPEAWRARVAWCPQDAHVFDSTLRANLLLARDRGHAPSDAEMRAVLERAGLGPLLRGLPAGLGTRVGPAGSALSGGERQRLAIARALLARADVILLDEPTAHLDAPTAAAVMADVRRATEDRIVLLVSHRASDIHPDDVVVTLGARPCPADDGGRAGASYASGPSTSFAMRKAVLAAGTPE